MLNEKQPPGNEINYLLEVKEHLIKKLKRYFYSYTYVNNGAVVISQTLDPLLLSKGEAEAIGNPHFCGKCNRLSKHVYYKQCNKLKCLTCANPLGNNDNRPYAKVINYTIFQQRTNDQSGPKEDNSNIS